MITELALQPALRLSRPVRLALSLLVLAVLALGPLSPASPAYAADCRTWHTVQRGETLYRIGLRYNMTWDRIAKANGITNANKIFAGQVLCIPAAEQPKPAPDVIVVLGTDVQFVLALTDVNMRVGPGTEYAIMSKIAGGQTAKVTGVSGDGKWWRVICPDDTVGNCWITAGARYTQPSGGVGQPPPSQTVPTITIAGVVRDQSVTIRAANFPAGHKFNVLMGEYGTAGVNGLHVTTIDSGSSGSFTQTFNIPAALAGRSKIAIRLQSASGAGYYSYNWFYNASAN